MGHPEVSMRGVCVCENFLIYLKTVTCFQYQNDAHYRKLWQKISSCERAPIAVDSKCSFLDVKWTPAVRAGIIT